MGVSLRTVLTDALVDDDGRKGGIAGGDDAQEVGRLYLAAARYGNCQRIPPKLKITRNIKEWIDFDLTTENRLCSEPLRKDDEREPDSTSLLHD